MSDLDRTTSPFEMRTATDDTAISFLAPLGAAFGEMWTEAELAAERKTWETDRIFGAFEGDRQVGTCGNYSFRMTVPGGDEVATAGITLVGVLPGERRRGILRRMMTHLLDDAIARQEPLAILWASEAAIYQRFGFGLGAWSGTFTVSRGRAAFLRPVAHEGRVRLVNAEEAFALLPPVYDGFRRRIPGMLALNEARWKHGVLHDDESLRGQMGLKQIVVFEADGAVEGFAVYRTKPEWEPSGAKGTATVIMAVGLTPRAERQLWSYLLTIDLFPNVKTVREQVPSPLSYLLAEPRALGQVVNDGIWLRLVDLPVALAARRFGGAGSLVLEVADGVLPANAGRWALTVGAAGVASVTRTDAAPDLVLDTADLAACYLGAMRPSALVRAGRVVAASPAAVGLADSLFATEAAPWCPTPF